MSASPPVQGKSAHQFEAAALPEMTKAVLVIDDKLRVEYGNRDAETLFSSHDILGSTLPGLVAGCGAEISGGILEAIHSGKRTVEFQIKLTDKRPLDCMSRPLSTGGYVVSLDGVPSPAGSVGFTERDAITGLFDRSSLEAQLVERLSEARGSPRCVAVLYLDLNRFKAVNDMLGHAMGDTLLQKVAGRLCSATCEGEIVGRLGGDKFVIIQSDASQPRTAESLAIRLIDLISRAYAINGHMVHVGASIGIAISPGDGHDAGVLLKNADLALYQAKGEGSGSYRFYEPGMDERMQARRAMEIDLRRALALKEMQVVYQPQFRIETGEIVGFEALIRWHHPQRGPVSPAVFIPLAEEIGEIVRIGEWVLREACRQAVLWKQPLAISVNLSPAQFVSGRILETITSVLAYTGLAPERLEIEITEGALLEDSNMVLQVLRSLRTLGVRIAMDDFGTGYSSLGYLRKFPFDTIKIDQSFVRDIDTDGERRAIVRAISQLASALGMSTIAEGVETAAELDCVRAEGCTAVQGYLTGRPQSAAAIMRMIDQNFSTDLVLERPHDGSA